MASISNPAIRRLQAAVTDGRTSNIRYRQNEFQKLHAILAENADAISVAIAKDTQGSTSEIETEIFLTLESLRHHYDSLDFAKELREEYSITNGENNVNRRVGVGIVLIRPTLHTRFYSILAPVLAAIASGNCILLELEETSLDIDTLLTDLLSRALDQDTFAILSERTTFSDIQSYCLVEQAQSSPSLTTKSNEIISNLQTRTLAIVDRTADIEAAAKVIVTARFSFQGTSPYAPDVVIVNDFIKKQFFEAVTKFASQIFAERRVGKGPVGAARIMNEEVRKSVKDAEAKGQVSSFGSSDFKILDISDRASPLTKLKISGYYLPIVQCTSITDAVFNQDTKSNFLAGYFFASPSAAKFCSQHLNCSITFVNQIPAQLLVGPASPTSLPPSIHPRYTTEMFSTLRPQYIAISPQSVLPISQILYVNSKISTKEVRKLAVTPLKPTGQGKGEAIGFFEQGIITGATILFGIVVPTTIYATWVLGRKGFQYFRR